MARRELKLDGSTGSIELVRALIDKLERRPLVSRLLFGRRDLDQLKRHEHRLKLQGALAGGDVLAKKPDVKPMAVGHGVIQQLARRPLPQITAIKGHPLLAAPLRMKLKTGRKAPTVSQIRDARARLYISTPGSKLETMIDNLRSISSKTSTSKSSDAV